MSCLLSPRPLKTLLLTVPVTLVTASAMTPAGIIDMTDVVPESGAGWSLAGMAALPALLPALPLIGRGITPSKLATMAGFINAVPQIWRPAPTCYDFPDRNCLKDLARSSGGNGKQGKFQPADAGSTEKHIVLLCGA